MFSLRSARKEGARRPPNPGLALCLCPPHPAPCSAPLCLTLCKCEVEILAVNTLSPSSRGQAALCHGPVSLVTPQQKGLEDQTEEAERDLCQGVLPEGTSGRFHRQGEGSILWCVREVGLGEETPLPAG